MGMSFTNFPEPILRKRIVPVAVIDRVEDAVPLAGAILQGGLDVVEVTFRTPAASDAIREIRKAFSDMLVGAGTLLTADQVHEANLAGAHFGVAPGVNEKVLETAHVVRLPFIPGVMTPSEVEQAISLGYRLLKFFPAEPAGGISMLKAIAGPYQHLGIRFIPRGGVNEENAAAYLAQPIVAAVGGTWFLDRKQIAARDWAGVSERVRAAAERLSSKT